MSICVTWAGYLVPQEKPGKLPNSQAPKQPERNPTDRIPNTHRHIPVPALLIHASVPKSTRIIFASQKSMERFPPYLAGNILSPSLGF